MTGPDSDAKAPQAGTIDTPVTSTDLQTDGTTASLPERDTKPFSMLGVSWSEPEKNVTGTIRARARSAESGKWSKWLTLDSEGNAAADGPRKGLRGAAGPAWFGPSDGVEVRVGGAGQLPKGMRLDMVDPGKSHALTAEPAAYSLDGEETPEASVSPTDTITPSDAASPSPSDAPTGTPSDDPATGTPSPSASDNPAPTATPTPTPTETAGPVSTGSAPEKEQRFDTTSGGTWRRAARPNVHEFRQQTTVK
ncbi:hypothetical protein [Streptomyces sp. NPDC051219]|uniref:hypothetical protein n=1 Tax=Streptomyces sp. NPDC051219 TaxID=3155283 RepID=UPI00342B7A52